MLVPLSFLPVFDFVYSLRYPETNSCGFSFLFVEEDVSISFLRFRSKSFSTRLEGELEKRMRASARNLPTLCQTTSQATPRSFSQAAPRHLFSSLRCSPSSTPSRVCCKNHKLPSSTQSLFLVGKTNSPLSPEFGFRKQYKLPSPSPPKLRGSLSQPEFVFRHQNKFT